MRLSFETTDGRRVTINFVHTRNDRPRTDTTLPGEKHHYRAVTECVLRDEHEAVAARRWARCSWSDNFCKERGRLIALGRAAHSLSFTHRKENLGRALAAYKAR